MVLNLYILIEVQIFCCCNVFSSVIWFGIIHFWLIKLNRIVHTQWLINMHSIDWNENLPICWRDGQKRPRIFAPFRESGRLDCCILLKTKTFLLLPTLLAFMFFFFAWRRKSLGQIPKPSALSTLKLARGPIFNPGIFN